jgi:RecB family exonuclease
MCVHVPIASDCSQLHAALLALYDAGVHQQALMQHAECELAPALAAMQQLAVQADIQQQQLQQEHEWLKQVSVLTRTD